MIRVIVGDDVARVLGPARTAAVRAGDTSAPVYECLVCKGAGDMRGEDTAAVLFVGCPTHDIMIMSWVHGRCGPSAVHPIADMHTLYGAPPTPGATVPTDTTWASVNRINDVTYPSITIMPGMSTRVVTPAGPGENLIIDIILDELRHAGFGRCLGHTVPPTPPGWAVHVDAGQLVSITCPGDTWREFTTPPLLPDSWRAAASRTRMALVLVVAPGCLPTTGDVDTDATNAAMTAADRAGMLVGALIPVRGTLSPRPAMRHQ